MPQEKAFSDKWKKRFDFFEEHGLPGSREYGQAIKNLKYFQRFPYMFNFYAFFFGLIYFCILGLWKKGLMLVALAIVSQMLVGVAEVIFNANLDHISRGLGIAYSAACASVANSAYYLRKIKGSDNWNPFEGMTKKSAARLEQLPSREYD